MKLTVEEIRAKYPKPVIVRMAAGRHSGEYCVSGALCLFLGDNSYPWGGALPGHLRRLTGMTMADADTFYNRIASLNDFGDFDGAWRILGEALNFQESR